MTQAISLRQGQMHNKKSEAKTQSKPCWVMYPFPLNWDLRLDNDDNETYTSV